MTIMHTSEALVAVLSVCNTLFFVVLCVQTHGVVAKQPHLTEDFMQRLTLSYSIPLKSLESRLRNRRLELNENCANNILIHIDTY